MPTREQWLLDAAAKLRERFAAGFNASE